MLRLQGCQQAMADAGLPQRSDLVHLGAVDTPR